MNILRVLSAQELTEVEAPHLVDGLPLPLAPEHDHGAAAERDRGVGVEAARARLAADWVPAPGAWTHAD